MTKCKRQTVTFSRPKSRKIPVDFNGREITFGSGAMLL